MEIGFDPTLFGFPQSPSGFASDAGGNLTPSDIGASFPDAPTAATAENLPSLVTAPTPPQIMPVLALLDTGASASCIDDSIAQQLNLPVINRVSVGGVGGSHQLNQYLCRISIPQLNFVKTGAFIGAGLAQGGQLHRALIGRDFLANMLLMYDGISGKAKLAV